jgi:hypothetical protein
MSRRECPNPKCRSTDVMLKTGIRRSFRCVLCPRCGMSGPHAETIEAADAAWNALSREPVWTSGPNKEGGHFLGRWLDKPDETFTLTFPGPWGDDEASFRFMADEIAGPISKPLEPKP